VALAERLASNAPKGRATPRLRPPTPARSLLKDWEAEASGIGIELFPWQRTVGRYLYAVGPGDLWQYPEVACVVARQNGKTEMLVPHVVRRLKMGRRIMHTAQNRELPREVFGRVADIMVEQHRDLLRSKPRFANGQEEIRLKNGGHYRIVAPTRGGARGPSNDDLIVDETRELDGFEFMAAAEPTLTASANPQVLFLSNAGEEDSVVLNALRARAAGDSGIAYLEWSAAPERKSSDRTGWAEANPSIGHLPGILPYLERKHRAYTEAGQLAIFETEHLCRWVITMRERLVDAFAWSRCEVAELPEPVRPAMAVSMDPSGTRASAAIAWQVDDAIAVRLLFDVTGEPIDAPRLGDDMAKMALRLGVTEVAYDPLTDADLARYFKKPRKVVGQEFANASARFVTAALSTKVRWLDDTGAITDDLAWTARKPHDESGSFQAVRSKDERPITASLAAIRAVWLASGPRPAIPKVM
jgi:hypothetical protein